jgi:choline kinase
MTSKVSRVIILAAGRGHQLDGINKILIKHPKTGMTIIDHAIEAFNGKIITVVVGFRAIQIMQKYPQLDYVINDDWALSNNAMSLGLALSEEPTYVISGDIFIDQDLIRELDECGSNIALTEFRENRTLTAIHCVLRGNMSIAEVYQGAVRDIAHPEAIGLFKISDAQLLKRWKKLCIRHGNLFVAQALPCDGEPVISVPLRNHLFKEINTHADYLRFIKECRSI